MSEHDLQTPIAAPFPAPNGVFDFAELKKRRGYDTVENSGLLSRVLGGNTFIAPDAAAVQTVKSLMCALMPCDCRIAAIDAGGACGLSVFNGCRALAAHAIESADEAFAALCLLEEELDKRAQSGVVSPDILVVFVDLDDRISDETAEKFVLIQRGANKFGMHCVCCAKKLRAETADVHIPRDGLPVATDGDIARTVAQFAADRA